MIPFDSIATKASKRPNVIAFLELNILRITNTKKRTKRYGKYFAKKTKDRSNTKELPITPLNQVIIK